MKYVCKKALSNILYKNKFNTYLMKNFWNVKKMTDSISFDFRNYIEEEQIFDVPSIKHDYTYSKLNNGMAIICDQRESTNLKLCINIDLGTRDEDDLSSGVLHQISNCSDRFIKPINSEYAMKYDEENMFFILNCESDNVGNEIFPRLSEKIFDINKLLKFKPKLSGELEELHRFDFHQSLLTTAFGFKTLGMPREGLFHNKKLLDKYLYQRFLLKNITPEKVIVFTNNQKNLHNIKESLEEFIPVYESKFEREQSIYLGGENRTLQEKNELTMILSFPTIEKTDKISLVFELLRIIFGECQKKKNLDELNQENLGRSHIIMEEHKFIREFKCINLCYSDNGLFGLYITGESNYSKQLFDILIEQVRKLSRIGSEELMFAKNHLSHSFTKKINDPQVNHELVISYYRDNKNLSFDNYLAKLKSIDNAQIKETVEKMLTEKPTFLVRGNKMNQIPPIKEYFPY